MAVKYTDDQLATIKSLMEICENFADQVWHIMQNHGLDKVDGTVLKIEVNPAYELITKEIQFGQNLESDSGTVKLTKGMKENRYAPTGKNSAEYECLFAEPEVAKRISQVLHNAKPLPPDGLWIGRNDDRPAVDCGV